MKDEFEFLVVDNQKLHLENVVINTAEGEVNINLPTNTGEYSVNIIPITDKVKDLEQRVGALERRVGEEI